MTTRGLYRCTACGWTGRRTELADTHGGPECPSCGARVLVG